MKVLHIAAHLGGGVGKAHAAMTPFMAGVDRTFALLTEPIDRRPIDAIARAGGNVLVATKEKIAQLAWEADVIQIEYWPHAALEAFLDAWRPPVAIPLTCWAHVATIQRLGVLPDVFIGTSAITKRVDAVINSGFGLPKTGRPQRKGVGPVYLGTVDFKKMHPDFFEAIDNSKSAALLEPLKVWGHIAADVAFAAKMMKNPRRVQLCGHTLNPASALAGGDIFLYPLRSDHYGTGENALVEAMSMGLAPVVLDNAAERTIVEHGTSGVVAGSVAEAIDAAAFLTRSPDLRHHLAENARLRAETLYTPRRSAQQFIDLWNGLWPNGKTDGLQLLALPDVTLVAVFTVAHDLTLRAVSDCMARANFGDVKLFTDKPSGQNSIPCPKFTDLIDAGNFTTYRVPEHIKTSHALFIHFDSWIVDPSMWRPEFLECDYIGAPWPWHPQGQRVGNSGFCLRSKRLIDFLADHPYEFPLREPEELTLCRFYRRRLPQFKWASEDLAYEFSFERNRATPSSFGFHGLFNWPQVLTDAEIEERLLDAPAYVTESQHHRELRAIMRNRGG